MLRGRKKKYRICLLFVCLSLLSYGEEISLEWKLSPNNMKEESQERKLDINRASRGDFLSAGISTKYIDGILDFREKVGAFERIEELRNIKGIGDATFQKLKKSLQVKTKPARKPIYVNRVDERTLLYYGFHKKEIKKFMKYREKRKRIVSNRELQQLFTKPHYEKYKDLFRYEK